MGMRDRVLLIFLLLVLYVEEGCNKRSRTGRISRGGSYSGGGYSSGGSSGSSGTTIAIVCGVIGGWVALSFLIYVCCMVYKRSKRNDNSAGVVVNLPNRTRLSPNLNQNQSGIVLSSLPPSYPETYKPVFDVQQAMYSTQLNGTPPNQERLPNMGIRPKSATGSAAKGRKYTTSRTNAGFAL